MLVLHLWRVLLLFLVREHVRFLSLCRLWQQLIYIYKVGVVLCLVLALLCPCFVVLEHGALWYSFVYSLFDM